MRVVEVVRQLESLAAPLVVITGGEPLNQQRRLVPLVRELLVRGMRVEVETNGTIAPSPDLPGEGVRFNVSPKLSNSGVSRHRRINPRALTGLAGTGRACFKFVCRDDEDLAEVAELELAYGLRPIWIMPLGRDGSQLNTCLAALADAVVARGWNLTTRLHVLAWGDERGR